VVFFAHPRCTSYTRTSHAFDVESLLKCSVHLLFMQDGVAVRSVLVVYLYWLISHPTYLAAENV